MTTELSVVIMREWLSWLATQLDPDGALRTKLRPLSTEPPPTKARAEMIGESEGAIHEPNRAPSCRGNSIGHDFCC
jgi:hypothetical protein